MKILKNSKTIALVTTALLVGSIFWLMNTRGINTSLEASLGKEKLNSESLLSEKLLLEKEIDRIKGQLSSLKGQNRELDDLAKATAEKLAQQASGYLRMKKENASLAQIKKQRQDLIALQHQLENELQSLKTAYGELESRNKELSTIIASLEERNQILVRDLNRAMFAVDHAQLQAVKGKAGKATVKARRTRKLIANFEVPANLQNLSFRIIDAMGNLMTQKQGTTTVTSTPSDASHVASSDPDAAGISMQKVEMVYAPAEKLRSGLYTVEILNENLYVGSLKVKLN